MQRPSIGVDTRPPSQDEQHLYINLCLLRITDAADKHGIELSRTSFSKPYPKGLELVLYYLYASIVGERKAEREFKNIWPVVDQKTQAKEFNQKITEWFKELKEKHQLDALGTTSASILRSAAGSRVVTTLLEISTLALSLETARLPRDPNTAAWTPKVPVEKDPKLALELSGLLHSLASVNVHKESQRFASLMRRAAAVQKHNEQYAKELQQQYYDLRATCERLDSTLGPELDEVTARLKHPERSMDQNDRTAALAGLLPDPLRPPREVQQGCRAMEELAAHLGRYGTLTSLVRQAVGSAVHPYAIDGAALAKALSGEEDSNGSTAGTGVGAVGMGGVGGQGPAGVRPVGVVEVLEGWVEEVEACEGWVSALAGGGSSGNGVSPLLCAPSDPTSHAALLATQLRSHKAAVDKLTLMKGQLQAHIAETDAYMQQLQPRLMAASQRVGAERGMASVGSSLSSLQGSQTVAVIPPSPLLLQQARAQARERYAQRRASVGLMGAAPFGSSFAGTGIGRFSLGGVPSAMHGSGWTAAAAVAAATGGSASQLNSYMPGMSSSASFATTQPRQHPGMYQRGSLDMPAHYGSKANMPPRPSFPTASTMSSSSAVGGGSSMFPNGMHQAHTLGAGGNVSNPAAGPQPFAAEGEVPPITPFTVSRRAWQPRMAVATGAAQAGMATPGESDGMDIDGDGEFGDPPTVGMPDITPVSRLDFVHQGRLINLDQAGDCDDLLAPDQDGDEWGASPGDGGGGGGDLDDTLDLQGAFFNLTLVKGLRESPAPSKAQAGGDAQQAGAGGGEWGGAASLQALGLGLTPPPQTNARRLSYSKAENAQ